MVSDERTLQLVGAGLLVLGLSAVACTAAMFPSRGRIKDISRANRLSWSPRGFGGRGDASPVFGLMWGTIFASQAVSAVVTIVVTLLGSDATDLYALFNGVACASAALALCAAWQPVFVIDEPWSFAFATSLLALAAVFAGVGAVSGKAFLGPTWWETLAGASTQLFSGWLLTAAGLSLGITTRSYNRGVNAPASDAGTSYFPLVLACVACIASALFAMPLYAVPIALTFLFIPNTFVDWRLWTGLLVALVGVALGAVMVFVYRASGVWF
jgi:hypothetical protein